MTGQQSLLDTLCVLRANLTDTPEGEVSESPDDPLGLEKHLVDKSSPQAELQLLVCKQIGELVTSRRGRPATKSAMGHASQLKNRRLSAGRSPSLKRPSSSGDVEDPKKKKTEPKSKLPTSK